MTAIATERTRTDTREAVAALIAAGRDFAARGWLPATSGNLSARIDTGHIAVTASGRDKGALAQGDLVTMALDAPIPSGVSAEAPLHVALYKRDPAIGAVLHVHSLAATLASLRDAPKHAIRLAGYEMLKALSGITTHDTVLDVPIFANDQDTAALAELVETRLAEDRRLVGYLIAGHGLYAWGHDVAEARRHVEAFDFLLTCELERGRLSR